MDDACRAPQHTQHSSPASGSPLLPGLRVLPLHPLLFALLSVCVSSPAEAVKGLNNRWEETKSLQGIIPDATVLMGKIFYYPMPVFAFQGTITHGADLPKWLEFNPNTSTLQGLPMAGEGGMYLLNITASGGAYGQGTPRAAANFTIHVQDSTPITSAEIILSTGAETLEVQERLSMVCRLAEYLHLPSSLLTLLQHTEPAARGSHILAEDTGHIDLPARHYVRLSWPVKCGAFAMLHELIQVLQHNVNSQHLSQLLGYDIAGWRILRRGNYERNSPRRHRRQLMITPTPALKPTRIIQRPAAGEASRPMFFAVPTSASLPHTSTISVPCKAEVSPEPSLITLSHPDTTPVPIMPEDFSTFHMLELSQPTNALPPSDSSSVLRAEPQPARILSSGTKQLLSDKDLGTSGILPNVTESTLKSHKISGIKPDAVEAPLVTLFNVAHAIKFLTATIGCLFFFPIPATTFYDEEDGNSTQLSLQILPADGSPWGSESWLQFNMSQQTMNGYPLETDFQYSPQEFVLSATDSGGLTAWETFTIELLKPPQVPCHLYTVRTKNSYSSFLRERKRVGLFLEKLSLFLNSSSPQDIAVMALQPGSTVISWYNSSLCQSANRSSSWCRNHEIQQALEKLRAPAGAVSPHFVQAMLPEYKIDVAFSISYSEDCPASTKPFPGLSSSTGPILQAENDSPMRRSSHVLLSSLCATAAVVLAIVVCWLCKCPRTIPGSQPVMFQTNSQLSHAHVELDALRPRKAPVHECRASPSPAVWNPSSAPLSSHEQCPRPLPIPHIPPPFQPPEYQLPPHYPEALTIHHNQGNIQRLKF
uniref:Dystroglycan 1 n=1 Tax=Malurus cyaneus samueli TaxID=2593467 RepID=A0A8C5XAJ7_9PASS